MAKLSNQFYASPSEITSLLQDVIGKYPVEMALVQKVPFSVQRVASGDRLSESSVVVADWALFSIGAIDDSATDARDCRMAHPDALTLESCTESHCFRRTIF